MPRASRTPRPQSTPRQSTVVTRLHPLIRRELGQIDLRCTEVVRVENDVALDVIVRNRPIQR